MSAASEGPTKHYRRQVLSEKAPGEFARGTNALAALARVVLNTRWRLYRMLALRRSSAARSCSRDGCTTISAARRPHHNNSRAANLTDESKRMKRALITGITGQDGSYLAELLLAKGYEVHGIIRRSSTFNTSRIDPIYSDPHNQGVRLRLHYGDLSDGTNLRRVMEAAKPDEVYNLAAQSHVKVSFEEAEYTADIVGTGTLRLLECLRDHIRQTEKPVRFLSGGLVGDVRGDTAAANREHAVLPAKSVCGGEGGGVSFRAQLSRSVRHVHRQRNPVQPRKRAARRDVCDAEDHARGGADQAGSSGEAVPG